MEKVLNNRGLFGKILEYRGSPRDFRVRFKRLMCAFIMVHGLFSPKPYCYYCDVWHTSARMYPFYVCSSCIRTRLREYMYRIEY